MLVSVVIPVFNCEKYINRCLDSVLEQTYNNIEIILVNDGSKDKSSTLISEYVKTDSRIKLINQRNTGPSEARNNGISKCSGEYIVFLDADDYIDKKYIELLLKKILECNCDIVACGYNEITNRGTQQFNEFYFHEEEIAKDIFSTYVCKGIGGTLWGKIFRRDIIYTNNIKMDSNIFMCEDLLFNLEYCYYANSFRAIKECLYYYNRENESSITKNININYLVNNINVSKKIEYWLEKIFINKSLIDELIVERIYGMIKALIINGGNDVLKIGMKKSKEKIKKIIEEEYVCSKIYKFKSRNAIDRYLITRMKKKGYRRIVIFSLGYTVLRSAKNKVYGE
ncbi:MAG: glycosyltransferase family 2 protein [Clostridium sp.]|uniref:glycosyltransferase family 2 protein n=1 Tax=Clostridium sp. TaxID=1506 RepID=UPI002FCC2D3E